MAVLDLLHPDAYADLSVRVTDFGARFAQVLNDALVAGSVTDVEGRNLTARVPVVGPLFGLFFVPEGEPDVVDYPGASASAATGLYARMFRAMLDRGVALAPGPYEIAFPSMAHGEEEMTMALEVASAAADEVLAG